MKGIIIGRLLRRKHYAYWRCQRLALIRLYLQLPDPSRLRILSIFLNRDWDFWITAGAFSIHEEPKSAKMVEDGGSRIEDRGLKVEDRFTSNDAILDL